MGQTVQWVSSFATEFNYDFGRTTDEGEKFGLSAFFPPRQTNLPFLLHEGPGVEALGTVWSLLDVMNLLRLPEAIQQVLQCPPAPLQIHSFSERRLRSILVGGDEASQARRWRLMVNELMSFAAK